MNRFFLSFFTPTYNRAHTLHRVYDSIKSQTLQKKEGKYLFEWIIVDDGSTDNTKELVEKWQKEVEFEIVYFYQENQGKPAASSKGIELARGDLFLFCDSDDAFLPETIETFYSTWNGFNKLEKEKCGGIGVLCQDQYGNRIGYDYPIEKELVPTIKTVFGWRDKGLGETWAALKTENLKKYFLIPKEARKLKFIPESFFWSRITFEAKQYSYCINKVLRVYYIDENDNISKNVRQKYPEGFLFESKWFINNYWWMIFKSPKTYIKHFLKYIIFSLQKKEKLINIMNSLDGVWLKILFIFLYLPAILLKNSYLNNTV